MFGRPTYRRRRSPRYSWACIPPPCRQWSSAAKGEGGEVELRWQGLARALYQSQGQQQQQGRQECRKWGGNRRPMRLTHQLKLSPARAACLSNLRLLATLRCRRIRQPHHSVKDAWMPALPGAPQTSPAHHRRQYQLPPPATPWPVLRDAGSHWSGDDHSRILGIVTRSAFGG